MRLAIALFSWSVSVWGCSCMAPGPPCQQAWAVAAVFSGEVVDLKGPQMRIHQPGKPLGPEDWNPRVVHFRVREAFLGIQGQQEVEVRTGLGGGDCGYAFERGRDYIVYAYRVPEGYLVTGICTRTAPLEKASEDLAYLRSLSEAAPGGEIRVQTIDAYNPKRYGRSYEELGLENVQLTIRGATGEKTGSTDASGRYVFPRLAPGEYTVTAALKGYAETQQLNPIKVPAKGCAAVMIAMRLDRRITGRVRSKDGIPASGVLIQLLEVRPLNPYQDFPSIVETVTTGAEGDFEFRNFSAGDYYLGVNLNRAPYKESPYTRWFHPGVAEKENATLVHVVDSPGEYTYDLVLPELQKERTIKGTVEWPDGRRVKDVDVMLIDPRWPHGINLNARTDEDGRFVLTGFHGTAYRIETRFGFRDQLMSSEPILIEAGAGERNFRLVLTRQESIRRR